MWKYVGGFARQNNHSSKETFCYTMQQRIDLPSIDASSKDVTFRVFGVNSKKNLIISHPLDIMYVYNL